MAVASQRGSTATAIACSPPTFMTRQADSIAELTAAHLFALGSHRYDDALPDARH